MGRSGGICVQWGEVIGAGICGCSAVSCDHRGNWTSGRPRHRVRDHKWRQVNIGRHSTPQTSSPDHAPDTARSQLSSSFQNSRPIASHSSEIFSLRRNRTSHFHTPTSTTISAPFKLAMPPPQRSTRSAPNALLQSLPKKTRKPRVEGAAPTASSPVLTRALLVPSSEESDNESEDALLTPTKRRAVNLDFEVQVQLPRRRKHSPPAKPDVVVSPGTKDKLRRLSAGGSVLGASMGRVSPRKSSHLKRKISTARKKASKNPAADTQDVVAVATPRTGGKRMRMASMDGNGSRGENINPSVPDNQELAELDDTERNSGPINHPKPKTPAKRVVKSKNNNTADPTSAAEDSAPRRKKAKTKSVGGNLVDESALMDKLMIAGITNYKDTLDAVEDQVPHKVVDSEDIQDSQTPVERKKEKNNEKQKVDEENIRGRREKEKTQEEEEIRRRGESDMANVLEGADKDYTPTPDDCDSDEEEDADLANCLGLIQKTVDKYDSTGITLHTLSKDFHSLKTLQVSSPMGGIGYYTLIDVLTAPLLANKGAPISMQESATLDKLMRVMHSLTHFHCIARGFDANLKRRIRMNLTQLRNIEKTQRAIKRVFDARGYVGDGTKWRVGNMWVGEDPAQEVVREANHEAIRRRNEEIERVLVQREKAVYGYCTPESVEERQDKGRRRVKSEGEAGGQRGQWIISVGEERCQSQSQNTDEGEDDDDGGIRVDSEKVNGERNRSIAREEVSSEEEEGEANEHYSEGIRISSEDADEEQSDEERSDEGQSGEEQIGEERDEEQSSDERSRSIYADSESIESEHSQGTHADEKPGYREKYYRYHPAEQQEVGSSEGREGTPIVIEEEEVEVVQVEGFGERAAKERARVEREARRGNGESDGAVSVLEDREWDEEEVDALLFGIEEYRGMFSTFCSCYFYG